MRRAARPRPRPLAPLPLFDPQEVTPCPVEVSPASGSAAAPLAPSAVAGAAPLATPSPAPENDPYAAEERAAILEYEAGFHRQVAERRAGLRGAR